MLTLPKPVTDAERTLYQTRLTEAKQAYHDLTVGGAIKVVVDQNGERVEYSVANASRLYAYIRALEDALSPTLAAYRQPKPIGFTF